MCVNVFEPQSSRANFSFEERVMKLGSKSVVSVIAAGLFALPMVASAGVISNQVDADRVVISFEAEDLNTVAGRTALEREIRGAAAKVCGEANYKKSRSLKNIAETRKCVESAISEALTDVSSGELQVSAR
jgi:UrcA family protein